MKSGSQIKQEPAQTTNKPIIAKEDIAIAPAVRTSYIGRAGMPCKVVAVKKPVRDAFFCDRPQIRALNLRHPVHPIMEEGKFKNSSLRDRDGEFFITPEGMTLLAEKVFFEDDKDHTKYNTNNIVFFDNDFYKLSLYLQQLTLKEGEDAKVLFIDHAHAIPFYIRNINGIYNIFLVDSEISHKGYMPYELLGLIMGELNHEYNLTISNSLLQKDAYSCFTFAFQALKYFAKHGAEVFPYLREHGRQFNENFMFNVLPAENLMPELIKFNQSDIKLSEDALNTIVSKKQNLTLRDYLQKFTFEDQGKKVNTAAITKKYKLFDKLNTYITGHTTQAIEPNQRAALPEPLQNTYKKFMR